MLELVTLALGKMFVEVAVSLASAKTILLMNSRLNRAKRIMFF